MLWKRTYWWTHLQSNITTSCCMASAVIFSPPSFPATTCFQCWELFLLATAAIGERVWLSRNMFVSCSSTRPTIHFQIYWLKMNAIWGQIFFIWKFFLCPKFASKVRRCGKIQCFHARSCPPCYLVLSYRCNWLLNWKLCPILSSPFILFHFEIFLMTLSLCLCFFFAHTFSSHSLLFIILICLCPSCRLTDLLSFPAESHEIVKWHKYFGHHVKIESGFGIIKERSSAQFNTSPIRIKLWLRNSQ